MRRSPALTAAALAVLLAAQGLAGQNAVSGRAAAVRLGGRMHVQYATSSVDSHREQFFFRRARLELDATVNVFLDARFQLEFGGGTADLRDAYMRLSFSPGFQVTAGQFKRPFDLFELASSVDLSLIERDGRVGGVNACSGVGGVCSFSRFTERLRYSDRDVGVKVSGVRGRLAYDAAVTNGSGANVPDENGTKSFSGRMVVSLPSRVTLGANLGIQDYVAPGVGDAHATAWGADMQVGTWRDGLLLQASLVAGDNWRKLRSPGTGVPVDPSLPVAPGTRPAPFRAFQAVASYYHPMESPRFAGLEPLLRVSFGDPDTGVDDDGGMVLTPGLMLYITGRSKIGFNVDVWSPSSGDAAHSLKLQTFLYF